MELIGELGVSFVELIRDVYVRGCWLPTSDPRTCTDIHHKSQTGPECHGITKYPSSKGNFSNRVQFSPFYNSPRFNMDLDIAWLCGSQF